MNSRHAAGAAAVDLGVAEAEGEVAVAHEWEVAAAERGSAAEVEVARATAAVISAGERRQCRGLLVADRSTCRAVAGSHSENCPRRALVVARVRVPETSRDPAAVVRVQIREQLRTGLVQRAQAPAGGQAATSWTIFLILEVVAGVELRDLLPDREQQPSEAQLLAAPRRSFCTNIRVGSDLAPAIWRISLVQALAAGASNFGPAI
jgi:hypothetical protein